MRSSTTSIILTCATLFAAAINASAANDDHGPYQHVWLHYDYMVSPTHTHAPDPEAIRMVVDAFKNHGIVLHIDPQHNEVAERRVIIFDVPGNPFASFDPRCTGPDAVAFSLLKARSFQPKSNHDWNYAIWGHQINTDAFDHALNCPTDPESGDSPDPTSAGMAELPGRNFVVSIGTIFDFNAAGATGCFLNFETGEFDQPCWPAPAWYQAGVFMHELGHNLGLQHGGDANFNWKPNYVSVMNYLYPAIPVTNNAGSLTINGVRVDYSDERLPDLMEWDLDETAGIPSSHPNDLIDYFISEPGLAIVVGPTNRPIDWNGDGDTTDTHVAAHISNSRFGFNRLTGFDDWNFVRQSLARGHPATPRRAVH